MLEDDVKNLARMNGTAAAVSMKSVGDIDASQEDICDDELDIILNRSSFVKAVGGVASEAAEGLVSDVPREGKMYDVVSAADNAPSLQGLF